VKRNVNAAHYENIPPYPDEKGAALVHGIIETVQGSTHKNALHSDYGLIELRAVLAEGLQWPYDYGFIPATLADDGDPLDLLFLIERPTFAGCLGKARVLGSVKIKKNGVENDRSIAAPQVMKGSPQATDGVKEIRALPERKVQSICRFLLEYSEEQGNELELIGLQGSKAAMKSIHGAAARFAADRNRPRR